MSPFLFITDSIIKTVEERKGIQTTLWTQPDDLDFTDDLAILSHRHQQMQEKVNKDTINQYHQYRARLFTGNTPGRTGDFHLSQLQ